MWKTIALILIISGFIVGMWFKDGYILGTAEDGLVFYNISHYYHQAEYTWMDYPGLGSPSLSLIALKPTLFLLSYIQNLGIPGFMIQAGLMWFLLITSGIGIYFLTKELFPDLPLKYIFLSVIFYWFNPITSVDVWNRFLLNYIFFFSLLPIGTYLFIKGIRSKEYAWSLGLNLSLFFFSYAFSYIAFTILFWIWLFMIVTVHILLEKDKISKLFSIKYFLVSFLLFCIINSWWILPLIFLNSSGISNPTTNVFLKQNNTGLLDALSKSIGSLRGIFQISNLSFLAKDSLEWVKVYYSPVLSILNYFLSGLIVYFIIKQRKKRMVLFLGTLFLILIFFSKGNNPPFGEVYNLIYQKILLFQVFRNPFEKFGFLLSLVITILLSSSIYEIAKSANRKFQKLIYPSFFIIIFFYLGFPVLSGLILTNKFAPTNNYSIGYKVKVPSYYKEAEEWLKRQGDNFRYVGLPIKDEGITYDWEKGYGGVELVVALFDSKGIFHSTSTPFFNQIVPEIEKTFLSETDFLKIANLVNAKYYILRYDIDYKSRNMTAPSIIENKLVQREKNGEVKKIAEFEKVSIWENLEWRDNTFYPAKIISTEKSFENIESFAKIDISIGEVLIEEINYPSGKNLLNQLENKVTISYKKINPTKYILHLENVSSPFLLVFSELYNDGWKASYLGKDVLKDHLRANVYANAWKVERTGDFDLSIEFIPQIWMDRGIFISIAGYIIISGSLLYLLILKRRI